jgi:S-adenosylmethionine decarboxylase
MEFYTDEVSTFDQHHSHDSFVGNSNNHIGITEKDHFITRDGITFAGTHLILDLWGASHLDDLEKMDAAFREAVIKSKATLLHIHLHHFTPSYGVSGVAVLAESHISVHTWPERDFAAFDIFMCGDAEPHRAVEVFQDYFKPTRITLNELNRGIITRDGHTRDG